MDKKLERQLDELAVLAGKSPCTVAVTGAGISFSAGGMSFDDTPRSEMRDMTALGDRGVLENDPERYYSLLYRCFLRSMFEAGPSPAHRALARLEKAGRLQGVITTNVDCLHTMAGSERVYEIQGSLQVNRCARCGARRDGYGIWAEGHAPRCPECGGGIWAFPFYSGIGLDGEALEGARTAIGEASLILLIGTSGPYGNAYWPYRNRSAAVVQINPGRTGFDSCADMNIRAGADEVLVPLAERLGAAGEGGHGGPRDADGR